MVKTAIISECKQYRYELTRTWDESMPKVLFIMLNPSTADADNDDPTIRRCIGFAKSWGYGGLIVCNLFAYRATNPKELLKCKDPVGISNIDHVSKACTNVEKVITAWGNYPIVDKLMKGKSAFRMLTHSLKKLHYIDISKTHCPKHPLYLSKELQPIKWKT